MNVLNEPIIELCVARCQHVADRCTSQNVELNLLVIPVFPMHGDFRREQSALKDIPYGRLLLPAMTTALRRQRKTFLYKFDIIRTA
jgi:hypothetical protein